MTSKREADGLILAQLKQLGCELEEGTESMADVDKFLLYRSTVVCLKSISRVNNREPEDYPEEMPSEMSLCFRTCTALTQAIKEFGYRGDITFDQFLYPNEHISRRILSWLVEQAQPLLEKGSKNGKDEDEDPTQSFKAKMNNVLNFLVNSTWTVKNQTGTEPISIDVTSRSVSWDNENIRWKSYSVNTSELMKAFVQSNSDELNDEGNDKITEQALMYYKKCAPHITEQVIKKDQLSSTVFEENARKVLEEQQLEDEWNEFGIDSGLTREEYFRQKQKKVDILVSDVLRGGNSNNLSIGKDIGIDSELPSLSDLLLDLNNNRNNSGETSSTFKKRLLFETEAEDVTRMMKNATTSAPKDAKSEEEKENEEEERRKKEIEELQNTIEAIQIRTDQLQTQKETFNAQIRQTEELIANEKQRNKELKTILQTEDATAKLLRDREKIKQLEQITSQAGQRLIVLANEWEQHRKPLIEKYRAMKEKLRDQKSEYKDLLNVAKQNRESMKEMIHSIKQKEELIVKKNEEYNQLPKDVDRSSYVNRILDIVRNIEKQNEEIAKILNENRDLSKEIAALSDKLSKTFQETEEMIYKEAQKDTEYKPLYKDVLEIRDLYETLIDCINQNGEALGSIRDLENQNELIKERNDSLNVERVMNDLQTIQNENQKLIQIVQSKKQQQ
ncbi:hypothetical protein ABK040_015506 [Willaertia magna]